MRRLHQTREPVAHPFRGEGFHSASKIVSEDRKPSAPACRRQAPRPEPYIYFFCNSVTDPRIVCPTIASVFGLILSIVSCGVCQYGTSFCVSRSMMSTEGTCRAVNE